MKAAPGRFMTVDETTAMLGRAGTPVGRTTVYRALERFSEDGLVSKIPSSEGEPVRYGYVDNAIDARLVCVDCHTVEPLVCEDLNAFVEHISVDHGFFLDRCRTVFYGVCGSCEKKREFARDHRDSDDRTETKH